ncbi:hypothetical protein [Mycobacterium sp. OAE908]|uniref:hypothetical protein n=1 Tax=Mycobacterium sp. OAE908 TaxID=2817899 RepID=UPI001AE1A19E
MTVRASQTYRAGVGAATPTMSPGRRQSVPAPSTKRIGLVAPVRATGETVTPQRYVLRVVTTKRDAAQGF